MPVSPQPILRHVLRERRFARNRKACLPCRERKVRCDGSKPCLTCSKRQHQDLCQYYQPLPYPVRSGGTIPAQPTLSPSQTATPRRQVALASFSSPAAEDSLQSDVLADVPEATAQKWPKPVSSPITEASPSILGGGSILAVTRQSSAPSPLEPNHQSAFEDGILPLLGMRGSSSLPAPTARSRPDDLLVGGMNNRETVILFETYRHNIHPFRAIIYDLGAVEELMCSLLDPDTDKEDHPESRDGMDAAGSRQTIQLRALLHAILAYGAQFSELPADRRIHLTQKHLTYTLDLLRNVHYLSNPSKEVLQTLMVLGCLLQNDMQPQAAWILGGTTIRLAIFLGIDKRARQYASGISPEEAKFLRLAITWQDALLSLAFDRPPATYEMSHEADLHPLDAASIDTLDYCRGMNWLSHLTLRHSSAIRSGSPVSSTQYVQLFQQVDKLDKFLVPYLRDRQRCSSLLEVQEHYGLLLHKNFLLSTLCRPLLSSHGRASMAEADAQAILQRFYTSLKHSARAFLHLRSISCQAKRSWAFAHNGLTAVLLLSFMKETRNLDETKKMQSELLESLMEEDEYGAASRDSGPLTQLSTTHQKAVRAIQALAKLAREEESAGAAERAAAATPPASCASSHVAEAPSLTALPEADLLQTGPLDMDDLLRNFDFSCYSPLEALDFIMSDQSTSGQEAFLL